MEQCIPIYILGEAFQRTACSVHASFKVFPMLSSIFYDFSYVVILQFQTVYYSDMLKWTAEIEFHKSLPHAVIQCNPTRWLFLRVRMDGKDWFCTHFTLWPYLPYHVFYFDLMVQKGWEYRILGIIIYTHSRG